MAASIRQAAVQGFLWSLVESIGSRGIQMLCSIIVARLLVPEDYGLVAIVMVGVTISEALLDSGFGSALIQKQNASRVDICSVFYLNVFAGLVSAGLFCLSASWIASFFQQPILTPLIRFTSLAIIINAAGLIQYTLINKDLNFRPLAVITMSSGLISGGLAIWMAANGFGVWSLVVQYVVSCLIRTFLLWVVNSWRPALLLSIDSLRTMYRFASRILATTLLNRASEHTYSLVIGKIFSPYDLGLVSRASQLQSVPSGTLAFVVGRVTFPVFARIQYDPERLRNAFRKAVTLLSLINLPAMVGLFVLADPLVVVLLTRKWSACVPYLRLFCAIGLLVPVEWVNLNLIQALGRSDLTLRFEILKKCLLLANVLLTWRWGIMPMIVGMIVSSLVAVCLETRCTGRLIDYSALRQLRDMFPYLVAATLMGLLVLGVGRTFAYPHLAIQLGIQLTVGCLSYIAACRLFRLSAFMEILNILSTLFSGQGRLARV